MEGVGKYRFSRSTGEPTMTLMWNTKKPLWLTGKTTIMYSSLCLLKGLFGMLEIGIYGRVLVKKSRKKQRYLQI